MSGQSVKAKRQKRDFKYSSQCFDDDGNTWKATQVFSILSSPAFYFLFFLFFSAISIIPCKPSMYEESKFHKEKNTFLPVNWF